ncbi:MAG: GspH/FimT family pseudopilin [Steroidobacteraceae bacterium]
MKNSRQSAACNGFTLLELMVGITVLGVLLAVGVPSFTSMIRTNRVATQTNQFIAALNFARNEAAARGLPVSICASDSAQSSCAAATSDTSWSNGWLIFTDRSGTAGAVDTGSGDLILIRAEAPTGGMQVNSGTNAFIRFASTGGLTNPASTATVFVKHASCSGTERRQISVLTTGLIRTTKVTCT